MINRLHQEILHQIAEKSGKGTTHTSSDSYLGNSNPRYEITTPVLRQIARTWIAGHKDLSASDFSELIGSLVRGKSSTEKMFAGILLGYSSKTQREFDPLVFDSWLDHLNGWAEIDAVCTGDYTVTHLLTRWKTWKPLLTKFSKDENVNKRRASLVFLTSPVRHHMDNRLAEAAFRNIDRLKSEKSGLITKAISWLLRSMDKHYRADLENYLEQNRETLPKIAVRETLVKLKTGTKSGGKSRKKPPFTS